MWRPALFGALAGGMGWGIRGQYGHETGAMIAGLLVALVLTLLACPRHSAGAVARAVAWCTVAMGIGGSMTYGQTIGLTQDAVLVGNAAALAWGMLGLAIKGGLWIGFAGAFLGMGLGGRRYGWPAVAAVLTALLALAAAGTWAINSPFDPARRVLPRIYFSDDWYWEPGADLKPRPEVWGGLLFALSGLIAWLWVRRDALAWRLALWGVLGGAIGFPLGQSLQAFHAWHRDWFSSGAWAVFDPLVNWWNVMETTFGAVMGATLGAGLWLNRHRIAVTLPDGARAPAGIGTALLAAHVTLLVLVDFSSVPWVDAVYDFGLALAFIPLVAVAADDRLAYWVMLPVTALPIAGKTLVASADSWATTREAWAIGLSALAVTSAAAAWFARSGARRRPAHTSLRTALALSAWLYFALNFAMSRLPWPWAPWTTRTPSVLVFAVCALGLTWLAWRYTAADPYIRTAAATRSNRDRAAKEGP